jgi:hypothetical protein
VSDIHLNRYSEGKCEELKSGYSVAQNRFKKRIFEMVAYKVTLHQNGRQRRRGMVQKMGSVELLLTVRLVLYIYISHLEILFITIAWTELYRSIQFARTGYGLPNAR